MQQKKREGSTKTKKGKKSAAAKKPTGGGKRLIDLKESTAKYSGDTKYYEFGSSAFDLAKVARNRVNRAEISLDESNQLRYLLFGSQKKNFQPSWKQGFFFNPNVSYGLW